MSEKDTQKAILDYLAAKGVLAFRMQTGMHISSYNGKTRAIHYGVPGMADILAFPRDVPTWLEVKAEKGKQSDLQKSFQTQVEDHGHRYLIARSVDDVAEALG